MPDYPDFDEALRRFQKFVAMQSAPEGWQTASVAPRRCRVLETSSQSVPTSAYPSAWRSYRWLMPPRLSTLLICLCTKLRRRSSSLDVPRWTKVELTFTTASGRSHQE